MRRRRGEGKVVGSVDENQVRRGRGRSEEEEEGGISNGVENDPNENE